MVANKVAMLKTYCSQPKKRPPEYYLDVIPNIIKIDFLTYHNIGSCLITQLMNKRDALVSPTSIAELFLVFLCHHFQRGSAMCPSPPINQQQRRLPPSSHKHTFSSTDTITSVYARRHLARHLAMTVHLVLITHRISQRPLCVCVHVCVCFQELLLGELRSKRDL